VLCGRKHIEQDRDPSSPPGPSGSAGIFPADGDPCRHNEARRLSGTMLEMPSKMSACTRPGLASARIFGEVGASSREHIAARCPDRPSRTLLQRTDRLVHDQRRVPDHLPSFLRPRSGRRRRAAGVAVMQARASNTMAGRRRAIVLNSSFASRIRPYDRGKHTSCRIETKHAGLGLFMMPLHPPTRSSRLPGGDRRESAARRAARLRRSVAVRAFLRHQRADPVALMFMANLVPQTSASTFDRRYHLPNGIQP